jgi:hypothetical protein
LFGKSNGKNHLGDLNTDGRIILKWILKEYRLRAWIGFIRLRVGQVSGSCEHGNEPSGSVRIGEFFWPAEWLSASDEIHCYTELVKSYLPDIWYNSYFKSQKTPKNFPKVSFSHIIPKRELWGFLCLQTDACR